MNIVVVPQAAGEFEDAAAHYDDKQPGLGQRFRDEVDRHIRWITQHAETPRPRPGGYRRVNLKIFPHYIAYVQIGETIWKKERVLHRFGYPFLSIPGFLPENGKGDRLFTHRPAPGLIA